jgi:hypothetical protein
MPGLSVSSERKSDQYFALTTPQLLFAVLFGMGLCSFFRVMPGMNRVRPGRVRVMRCLLVMPGLVMLCRLTVVPSCMRKMF